MLHNWSLLSHFLLQLPVCIFSMFQQRGRYSYLSNPICAQENHSVCVPCKTDCTWVSPLPRWQQGEGKYPSPLLGISRLGLILELKLLCCCSWPGTSQTRFSACFCRTSAAVQGLWHYRPALVAVPLLYIWLYPLGHCRGWTPSCSQAKMRIPQAQSLPLKIRVFFSYKWQFIFKWSGWDRTFPLRTPFKCVCVCVVIVKPSIMCA